jgi:peptidoglycan/LPS O-acetylase OafA/YrhL
MAVDGVAGATNRCSSPARRLRRVEDVDAPGGAGGRVEDGSNTGTEDLGGRHLPALDGLRAVAVAAVIAYHLGLGAFRGGYLGVDLFFVLSGFLITGLLVEERSTSGRVNLPHFWARRARRLFPALLAMLGAVAVDAVAGGPGVNRQQLWGDTLATLFYVANWHFIASHSSYFAQFTAPSPLEHTWSLAIEEQFYVAWPILILVFGKLGGRRWRRLAATSTIGLAGLSVLAMVLAVQGTSDVTRAYFGTDSRAFELMIGAVLAIWMASSRARALSPARLRTLHAAGVIAACLLVTGFVVLGGPPRWLFEGGLVGFALLVAMVIASVGRLEHGPLGALLSLPPVRWVGRISYGLYLWHWPVCVFVTADSTNFPGWEVDVLRVMITLGLATTSFYLLEQPIRRHGIPGFRGVRALVPTVLAGAVVLELATVSTPVAGAEPPPHFTPAGTDLFRLPTPPTTARPLRVMFVGDSVMEFAATGLKPALQATRVIKASSAAIPGWGLTSYSLWRSRLQADINRLRPQVVMGTWSYDRVPATDDPTAYARLLGDFLDAVLAPGNGVQGVVFLEFPEVGSPFTSRPATTTNQQIQVWNDAVRSAAARRPARVGFLAVAHSVELNGNYSQWLPDARGRWVRVRSTDNFHLCPAGTARYAAAVLTDLEYAWNVPVPSRAWWTEGWTHNYLYLSGDCPKDQPPR